MNRWIIPDKCNEGCYDVALIQSHSTGGVAELRLLAFQLTVSPEHTLKYQYLRLLIDCLRKQLGLPISRIDVFFVIPRSQEKFRHNPAEGLPRKLPERQVKKSKTEETLNTKPSSKQESEHKKSKDANVIEEGEILYDDGSEKIVTHNRRLISKVFD